MGERRFLPGKFTDLADPRQLGMLNDLVNQILSILNAFDQGSFALAWIEGDTAGQVIISKGTGNAPEWSPTPTLSGATFSGLTASLPVVTTAAKALASLAYTGGTSLRKNLALETTDSPTWAEVNSTGDLISDSGTNGLVLKDTQNPSHYWRVTISNAGALVITDVGTTKP